MLDAARGRARGIPRLTRSIAVTVRAGPPGGSYNDAYVDDVALVPQVPALPGVPPPPRPRAAAVRRRRAAGSSRARGARPARACASAARIAAAGPLRAASLTLARRRSVILGSAADRAPARARSRRVRIPLSRRERRRLRRRSPRPRVRSRCATPRASPARSPHRCGSCDVKLAPCSSSSTSATRRPTSAPSATASCVEHWRFATVRESTADELGAALRNLLGLRGVDFEMLDGVDRLLDRARSCAPEWTAMAAPLPRPPTMPVVGPGLKTGMPIRYDNPREIGADRLVNAVAGYDRFGGPCVVVDFGTGVTHDVVSRRRRVPRRHDLPGRRDLDGGADRRAAPRCRDRARGRRAR